VFGVKQAGVNVMSECRSYYHIINAAVSDAFYEVVIANFPHLTSDFIVVTFIIMEMLLMGNDVGLQLSFGGSVTHNEL